MTIATLDDYRNSLRQRITLSRPNASPQLNAWASLWAYSSYGGGAAGNTTSGVVPTSSTTGAPPLNSFGGTGYLSRVECVATTGIATSDSFGRIAIVDRIYHAGAWPGQTGVVTLSGQPSFLSRLPSGSYAGTQLWVECLSSSAGGIPLSATYTNENGVAGRSTASVTTLTGAGRATLLSLQAGDKGVSKLESVNIGNGGGPPFGSYNFVITRPLFYGAIRCDGIVTSRYTNRVWPMEETGLPIVYNTSCLMTLFFDDQGLGGPNFELEAEIASL